MAGGRGQVVGRCDDGFATLRLGHEECHDGLLGGMSTPGRLVEQVQIDFGGHRAGQERATPLTAESAPIGERARSSIPTRSSAASTALLSARPGWRSGPRRG